MDLEVSDGRENLDALLADGFRLEASGWKSERVLFWSTEGGGHPADALVAQATEAHVFPSPLVSSGASFSATWAAGPPRLPRPAKPKTGKASTL